MTLDTFRLGLEQLPTIPLTDCDRLVVTGDEAIEGGVTREQSSLVTRDRLRNGIDG